MSSPTLATSALPDSGVYVVALQLERPLGIAVGALGRLDFPAGTYWYVGSAKRGLPDRLARHARAVKRLRWHIDYLTTLVPVTVAWVWRWEAGLECRIAAHVAEAAVVVPGFGSSDCRCKGHLFRCRENGDWLFPTVGQFPEPVVSVLPGPQSDLHTVSVTAFHGEPIEQ